MRRAADGTTHTNKGAWEGDAPYYADELALARLRILARQGRTEAYINLATAEGQIELAINMLAQSSRTTEAVTQAKAYLPYPRAILSLATVLAAQEEMDAALDLAEYGLALSETMGKVELARWTRDQAQAVGDDKLALKAAQTAFDASYDLVDYTAVQQLSSEQWPELKPLLLHKLESCGSASKKIGVYLHENMLTAAMRVLDNERYILDHDLRRVIEVTREKYPDWGIQKYQRQAEAIMDAGQSGAYDTAVSWLSHARNIYQQHQRQPEWRAYLDGLIREHGRKYKLVPMLRDIR